MELGSPAIRGLGFRVTRGLGFRALGVQELQGFRVMSYGGFRGLGVLGYKCGGLQKLRLGFILGPVSCRAECFSGWGGSQRQASSSTGETQRSK